MPDLTDWAVAVLPKVIVALLILAVGVWLARWAVRAFLRLLEHHRVVDPTFRGVLTALVRYSILLLAALAALQQLGLQTTSMLAALGAVLVAVGLALQGTLSNLAAGLMLLWLRPFRVGDSIETSTVSGEVTEVGLFATEVRRLDGVYVFVPNTDLWSKPLANVSRMPSRMLVLRLPLKRSDDLHAVRERLLAIAASNRQAREHPPPVVDVAEWTEAGPVLALRVWVETAAFRQVLVQLSEGVSAALVSGEPRAPDPLGPDP